MKAIYSIYILRTVKEHQNSNHDRLKRGFDRLTHTHTEGRKPCGFQRSKNIITQLTVEYKWAAGCLWSATRSALPPCDWLSAGVSG